MSECKNCKKLAGEVEDLRRDLKRRTPEMAAAMDQRVVDALKRCQKRARKAEDQRDALAGRVESCRESHASLFDERQALEERVEELEARLSGMPHSDYA